MINPCSPNSYNSFKAARAGPKCSCPEVTTLRGRGDCSEAMRSFCRLRGLCEGSGLISVESSSMDSRFTNVVRAGIGDRDDVFVELMVDRPRRKSREAKVLAREAWRAERSSSEDESGELERSLLATLL